MPIHLPIKCPFSLKNEMFYLPIKSPFNLRFFWL
nr:MAG TPA: hypothetical protein [Caudoviricetes sp.]